MAAKAPDTLSERERRFVDAFMGEAAGNGALAARLAGYSAKGDRVAANRLLTKRNVKAAIDARTAADPKVLTRTERQQLWSGWVNNPDVPWPCRVKASELLGKSQADFVERHEHAGIGGGPIVVKFGGRYRQASA
jgi:phage terminase small subunit